MNRLANINNPFQGKTKKVLCVCSAGLLRSPTAAVVLSQPPYGFNTRAVGCVREYALIPIDAVLVEWADEIVCMQREHVDRLPPVSEDTVIICLDIKDEYQYRDEGLMKLIAERYDEAQAELSRAFGG